jgi:hypothetical protein
MLGRSGRPFIVKSSGARQERDSPVLSSEGRCTLLP